MGLVDGFSSRKYVRAFPTQGAAGQDGAQGPPGTVGTAEAAKRLETPFTLGETASALRLVYSGDNSGRVFLGDPSARESSLIAGITLQAGSTNSVVNGLTFGLVEDAFFSAARNTVYYLAANGVPTTTEPTSGYLVRVGWTLRPGLFFLKVEQPIFRG